MAAGRAAPAPNRWKALALVCVASFIVVLDVSIVKVALPTIALDLDFEQDTLQWVIIAYSAGLFGRRKVFVIAMALFVPGDCVARVASGLLNTSQQIGGALGVGIISTVSTTHTENLIKEGTERRLAVYELGRSERRA